MLRLRGDMEAVTIQDEAAALLALSDGLSLRDLAEATGTSSGGLSPILEAMGATAAMGEQDGRGVLFYSLPEGHKARGEVMAAKDRIKALFEAHPEQRFDVAEVVAKTGVPEGTARGVLNNGALRGEWVKHEPGEGRRTVTFQAIQSGFAVPGPMREEARALAASEAERQADAAIVREVAMEIDRKMMDGAKPSEPAKPKGGLAAVFGKIPDMPLPDDLARVLAECPPESPKAFGDLSLDFDPTLNELLKVEREIGRLMERRDALRARLAG